MQADLQGDLSKSTVTPEQKTQLKNDLAATLQGAQKPSQESVDKLATDLTNATTDGKLTSKELLAIQKDVNAVLNSANISDAQISTLTTEVQGIVKASGLTKADAQVIVADCKAIATTAQANAKAAAAAHPPK